jgi:hypothetical protein
MAKDDEGRRARPLALGYAERVPLGERPGRYDEAREVWVVKDGEGVVPLIRTREVTLDDTVTKIRADPADPSWPRRGAGDAADGGSRAGVRPLALDETETRMRADPGDPANPRRGGANFGDGDSHPGIARAVLGDTKTSQRADPEDRPSPRRSTIRRRAPDGTLRS